MVSSVLRLWGQIVSAFLPRHSTSLWAAVSEGTGKEQDCDTARSFLCLLGIKYVPAHEHIPHRGEAHPEQEYVLLCKAKAVGACGELMIHMQSLGGSLLPSALPLQVLGTGWT